MSNDNMGNLEKLGILVIVILVVVVGVVAITPTETLFPSDGGGAVADGDPGDSRFESLDGDVPELDIRERVADGGVNLPIWPDDNSGVGTASREDKFRPQDLDHEVKSVDLPPGRVPLPPVADRDGTSGEIIEPVSVEAVRVEPAKPAFRTVKVKKGDTLIGIAERELNDGKRYREIMALNPDIDPRRMREGTPVRIPTGAAAAAGGRTHRSAPRDGRRPELAPPAGERKYVVKAGQTAGEISAAVYGTSKHWKLILDHNGIDDPRSVRAGSTLRIPPLPTTSANVAPAHSNTGSTSGTATGTASGASGRTYTVQPGDTAGQIAKAELGDFQRWRELLEFNGIKRARDLRAGSTIRLPR